MNILKGDCVKISDGRIGRVRDGSGENFRIRVRRETSTSHQFLKLTKRQLTLVACPKGWMSRDGYNKYLKTTLAKMKIRNKKKK
jgi:hypothetical protein